MTRAEPSQLQRPKRKYNETEVKLMSGHRSRPRLGNIYKGSILDDNAHILLSEDTKKKAT